MKAIRFATLIAFAIHVILPFFAVYSLPLSKTNLNSPVVDKSSIIHASVQPKKKFVVCTKHGFMLVASTDIEKTFDAQQSSTPKSNPLFKCPLCYATAYGFKDLVFVNYYEFLKFLIIENFKNINTTRSLSVDSSSLQIPQIRAPPHLF